MNHSTRADSRTWNATVTYQECGVVTERITYTVTLTRTPAGIEATVNGEACALERALNILRGATELKMTSEVLAPPTIRRTYAAHLHRLMGRVGLRKGEHYALASAALERPVSSFAALTEPEAEIVFSFLLDTHPQVAA
ncbi:hypothetical protein [Deinococcus multiflagellatus]|uniref:Uncharacterized protein n=1 Tax=Deinococcus multiflagellatus TaxID=1656887 RepID=A0ABW1ZGX3_9DEIO|nr:hypothetical protein [Deinococcus multiflagellatus]MBZ9713725.1 hypothetical protein [Deinococcus multiflagellatus]